MVTSLCFDTPINIYSCYYFIPVVCFVEFCLAMRFCILSSTFFFYLHCSVLSCFVVLFLYILLSFPILVMLYLHFISVYQVPYVASVFSHTVIWLFFFRSESLFSLMYLFHISFFVPINFVVGFVILFLVHCIISTIVTMLTRHGDTMFILSSRSSLFKHSW